MQPSIPVTALAATVLSVALLGGLSAHDGLPELAPADREAQRAHYAAVEAELRSADVRHLSPEACARRAELLDDLRVFHERGEFGRNVDLPGRAPYFADPEGRLCGVANLLWQSGERDFVRRVARERNHVWIPELADDPELGPLYRDWLDRSGLTLAETARIHAPIPPPRPQPPPYDGPGDINGRTRRAAPTGPSVGGPASPAPPGPAGPATPGPMSPRSPVITAFSDPAVTGELAAWWVWWEMNKLEFLRPNGLRLMSGPVTVPSLGDVLPDDALAVRRGELLHVARAAAEHPSADVRAAAAVALGRIAGRDALPLLRPLLRDTSDLVRRRAILAVGATGAPEAASLLVEIARHGAESARERSALSALARPTAVVALAILSQRSSDLAPAIESVVRGLASEDGARRDGDLELALLLHERITGRGALIDWASGLADEGRHRGDVRCRAIELERVHGDSARLKDLTEHLHGGHLDRRRSAAMAFGLAEHELALPTLLTAHDLEREAVTRAFELVSIGRRGGPGAREHLVTALEKGPRALRPWAALGLGLIARSGGDEEARRAVREGYEREASTSSRGAYLLAMGIGRDRAAYATCRKALSGSRDPSLRMYAGVGLTLLAGPVARAALLEAIEAEESPTTRVALAHALGTIGDARDAKVLVDVLTEVDDPDLQAIASLAVGFHGTGDAVALLGDALSPGFALPASGRAACLDALGMLLDQGPNLNLAEISRQSNFTQFVPWVIELLQVTL